MSPEVLNIKLVDVMILERYLDTPLQVLVLMIDPVIYCSQYVILPVTSYMPIK